MVEYQAGREISSDHKLTLPPSNGPAAHSRRAGHDTGRAGFWFGHAGGAEPAASRLTRRKDRKPEVVGWSRAPSLLQYSPPVCGREGRERGRQLVESRQIAKPLLADVGAVRRGPYCAIRPTNKPPPPPKKKKKPTPEFLLTKKKNQPRSSC